MSYIQRELAVLQVSLTNNERQIQEICLNHDISNFTPNIFAHINKDENNNTDENTQILQCKKAMRLMQSVILENAKLRVIFAFIFYVFCLVFLCFFGVIFGYSRTYKHIRLSFFFDSTFFFFENQNCVNLRKNKNFKQKKNNKIHV